MEKKEKEQKTYTKQNLIFVGVISFLVGAIIVAGIFSINNKNHRKDDFIRNNRPEQSMQAGDFNNGKDDFNMKQKQDNNKQNPAPQSEEPNNSNNNNASTNLEPQNNNSTENKT